MVPLSLPWRLFFAACFLVIIGVLVSVDIRTGNRIAALEEDFRSLDLGELVSSYEDAVVAEIVEAALADVDPDDVGANVARIVATLRRIDERAYANYIMLLSVNEVIICNVPAYADLRDDCDDLHFVPLGSGRW